MIKQNSTIPIGQLHIPPSLTLEAASKAITSTMASSGFPVSVSEEEIRLGGAVFGSKRPCLKVVNVDHEKDYYHVCIFLPECNLLSVSFAGNSRFRNADAAKDLLFNPNADMGGRAVMGFLGDAAVNSFNKSARSRELATGVTREAIALVGDIASGGLANLGNRRERRLAEDEYYEHLLNTIAMLAEEA